MPNTVTSLLEKHNHWISTEVIEVLKHNPNYSNWVDKYACEGKWKIEISDQDKKINIYMPVSEWGKSHSGYWTVFSGRMELSDRQLLIWQNSEVPANLMYEEHSDTISLWLFGKQIIFEKAA